METTILIYATHGTYGRDDDSYGTMLMANAALAKGVPTTLLLVDDGVAMAVAGQDTSRLGLPNNLDEITDFLDLGGRLCILRGSLEERGIRKDELVEGAEVVDTGDVVDLIEGHRITLTF
ncbi:MAG TPA: hypothetical protein EYP43_00315 [Thermoplasmata archaeon]|nr:hypothetical protein [Thermoplasmata archaeon]